ncbi:receptor like protein 26-like [Punica granatum]|uniref:Receptor like protein 26-like n=1 Tax=Punica granatum TaxID=22663 RepID=A0A6P8CXM0_PUNGR|nr:receptor like protein 26-like [Punica granatum]
MAESSSLFIVFVYLFPLLFHLLTAASHSVPWCHEDERSALMQLKQSLKEGPEYCSKLYDSWGDDKKLESWQLEGGQEGSNCCTWSGVQCDGRTNHVIGLDLRKACLYGSINSSSSLFRLSHLENLDLSLNNFNFSPIPPAIGNLWRLTMLDLSANVFTGEIPSSFSNLTRLSYLDLSVNQLTGQIPSLLGNIHQLSEIDLGYNKLTGQVPSSFQNLTQLSRLRLNQNQLTGQIPSFFTTLNELRMLYLSKNRLTGQIPSFLGNLSQLSKLDLSVNQLTGQMPSFVWNFTQISRLRLGQNQLTGPIPSQLGSLIYLEYLDLSLNRFHGPVPSSISHLSNLWYLNVYGNNLSGNLNLGMFSGLQGLMALVLSFNDFTLLPEPNASESYPLFRSLGLASCKLHEVPEFLRHQHDLKWLDLSYNNISGQIPEWFSGFVSVRSLNLSYNSLTGFPQHPVFLNWTRLRSLDVRSNQLQGPLPAVPHASIQFYFVSNNRLSGTISPVICNMNNIQLLDLAKNNFSSVIPRCLSNLSSTLTVLSLHDNNFYGGIPQLSKGTCSLRMIDFSSNLLEGPLPRSLANCTELEFLNMGNNMIRDIFPSWLGSLANLKVLILQSNRLQGPIMEPKSNFEFPNLQILDLSRNKLVGLLPSNYFQYWKAMRVLNTGGSSYIGYSWNVPQSPFMSSFVSVKGGYDFSMTIVNKGTVMVYAKILEYLTVIDLSSNNFTGEIPKSIGSLEGLHLLNLSHNLLAGRIPPALNGLTNLEALDLSRNHLSGEIPEKLTELTYLAVFNVSYNQLSGSIPRVKQFNTFDNSSYKGNAGLCGEPLSKKCAGPDNVAPPAPAAGDDHEGSNTLFDDFDWKIILMGFASGLVIGVVLGQGISIRGDNLFVRKFGRRYRRRHA